MCGWNEVLPGLCAASCFAETSLRRDPSDSSGWPQSSAGSSSRLSNQLADHSQNWSSVICELNGQLRSWKTRQQTGVLWISCVPVQLEWCFTRCAFVALREWPKWASILDVFASVLNVSSILHYCELKKSKTLGSLRKLRNILKALTKYKLELQLVLFYLMQQ